MKKIDLESDIKEAIKSEYDFLGLTYKANKSLDELLLDLFTVHEKIVKPVPRKIRFTSEIQQNLITHSRKDVVNLISNKLRVGEDVNCFQSDRLWQTKFYDHLLIDWKIYHFHLSTKVNNKTQKLKRGDPLLFVYIDDHQAIFLDVDNHGKGVFGDSKWLELIDRNFPKILESFVNPRAKAITSTINPKLRQEAWAKGYSIPFTNVNGKVISSPGIGRACSGHSHRTVITVNKIHRWTNKLTEQLSQYGEKICRYIGVDLSTASFKIQLDSISMFDLIEESSGITILSYDQELNVDLLKSQ